MQVRRDVKLNMDQQRTLYVNKVNYMLGYVQSSVTIRLRKLLFQPETGEDLPDMLGLVLGCLLHEGHQETEAGPTRNCWDG